MKEKYKFFSNILQTFLSKLYFGFQGWCGKQNRSNNTKSYFKNAENIAYFADTFSIVNITVKTKNLPNCYIDEIEGSPYLSIKTNIF